ncbi:MAG: hypothetical protein CMN56_09580 [Sneathiella sp.]|uniref:hypothetical protein n=1 Tax=Sneathiella sp. TaxID=1964365 RepID=UPI000C3E3CBB|nr:hypothetical protein [Sneathiella sp.]MAZ03377.1 hypothetical protein [Sneathiella sp.]
MLTSYLRLAVLALIVFVASACEQRVQPFYNPANVPVPKELLATPLEDIGDAIKRAGDSQKWKMTDTGPGEIEGIFRIRTHQATVRIEYSTIVYSITYVSSINLLDDGTGIHRNYNKWVRNLESAINRNLKDLAISEARAPVSEHDQAMLDAWKRAENSTDPLVLQEFMDTYENSPFNVLAQKRLNELAQLRTGGIKKFDPTGLWQVTVTYKGGTGNSNWCGGNRKWNFTLDMVRGKISRTVYDSRSALNVTGENSQDYVYLHFDYPTGGGKWEWTERFTLDRDEKRLTLTSEGGAPSGCTGTLGVHMKKVDTVGSTSGAPASTSTYSSRYDPTGNWRVIVRYVRGADNLNNCPRNGRWEFVLTLPRGKFSKTQWDGDLPLYIEGENSDTFFDLNLNGPLYSGEFEWTDRFAIDSDEERFEAKADGACPGIMKLYMKKVDTVGSTSSAPASLPARSGFDPTGLWQVNATYTSSSGASSSCIQNVNWNFTLDFHRGNISRTVYSGRTPLYLNGGNNPDSVDLTINVPDGGTAWRWTERFVLDGPEKFFRATSPSGGGTYGQCHGVIGMRMTKID